MPSAVFIWWATFGTQLCPSPKSNPFSISPICGSFPQVGFPLCTESAKALPNPLTKSPKCDIIHLLHSLILRSKFTFGKNVGFACHIFERCELCSNRSETAFFGAWFRLRTFLLGVFMKKFLSSALCIIIAIMCVGCNNSQPSNLECSNCGLAITDNAKFCSNCGEPITNNPEENNNENSKDSIVYCFKSRKNILW